MSYEAQLGIGDYNAVSDRVGSVQAKPSLVRLVQERKGQKEKSPRPRLDIRQVARNNKTTHEKKNEKKRGTKKEPEHALVGA